jgi:hypothetical protein
VPEKTRRRSVEGKPADAEGQHNAARATEAPKRKRNRSTRDQLDAKRQEVWELKEKVKHETAESENRARHVLVVMQAGLTWDEFEEVTGIPIRQAQRDLARMKRSTGLVTGAFPPCGVSSGIELLAEIADRYIQYPLLHKYWRSRRANNEARRKEEQQLRTDLRRR